MAAPCCSAASSSPARASCKRAWQIYVAHIFLFAIYIAEIAYVASSFENPLYVEEMNALNFLKQPEITIIQALLLKFKPVNMDVLPLYIVLLLLFPAILWLLMRNALLALAASVALYALTWEFGWNIPSYPSGHWFFNPFAWQLLFVFGAWCALGGAARLAPALRSPVTLWIAIGYLLFAFAITLTWHFPRLGFLVPRWLGEWMYPIDKINLDVLRFAHFLALAALTVRFIPRDWPACSRAGCGRRSCADSTRWRSSASACSWPLPRISSWSRFSAASLMQVLLSVAGILIMVGDRGADLVVQTVEGRGRVTPKRPPDADLAGGEA